MKTLTNLNNINRTKTGRRAFTILGVLTLLTTLTFPAVAGRVGGEVCKDDIVYAGTTDSYRITFRGGERATIQAKGDGDIDMYIYNSNGTLVGTDDGADNEPGLTWIPVRTQTYTVRIKNTESYDVDYHLDSN
jgi:hypothetical protein